MVHMGGAQLTDRAHILHGLRQGHDVAIAVPEGPAPAIDVVDGVVVSNGQAFPLSTFQELAAGTVPYVFFLHDFWPMCKYRLYYSQEDKCRECYLKPRWLPILQKARLLIWLSPLHREAWLHSQPELEGHPYALVPSPVDPGKFYDMGLERRGTLAVDAGVGFKGGDNFIAWAKAHPEEPITLVGGNPENRELPPNVTLQGTVAYEHMVREFNNHVRFLHLPSNTQPFERTVAESILAGCKVTANKNVGALSWPFMHQGREAVAQDLSLAPARFWAALEGAFKP